MDARGVLSFIASAAHLTFAYLIWRSRAKGRIAPVLAVLALDLCAWNFADLAYNVSGVEAWYWIDHGSSSLTPALALHVVLVFIGRTRVYRKWLLAVYVASMGLAAFATTDAWSMALLALAAVVLLATTGLIISYRFRAPDRAERARADLVLVAFVVGTVVTSTDVWPPELGVPRLGHVGSLLALTALAVGTLRLELLGPDAQVLLPTSTLGAIALCIVACAAIVLTFNPSTGLALLGSTSVVAVGYAVLRGVTHAQAVNRERSRRQALLGRFAEQLAHDLKNPLAALKGALQFMATERDAGRSLDPRASSLDLMLDQVTRLERCIDHYQRMAAVVPVRSPANVNEVVRGVLSLHSFTKTTGITFRCVLSNEIPAGRFDQDLVATALENLLRNACEAMPDGGTVTIVTKRSKEHPDQAVITVEDTGGGMDARELERAGDEFYTTKASGTGLGLHFVRRVAEAHGGALRLESQIGRGTCARLSVALAAGAPLE